MSVPRTVAATRHAPPTDAMLSATPVKPGQWSGFARLGIIAGLALLGWAVILIPIL